MIEQAQNIFNYLPLEYKTQIENDYIVFLWEAFILNYEEKKFQFAYIAYHMLFMCFVYFELVKIYLNQSENIKNIMIFTGKVYKEVENYEKKVEEAKAKNRAIPNFDPFKLALENERSIVGLFITIGCDRELVLKMKNLIDRRNDIAHSNGNISFGSQENLDNSIDEIIDCIDRIQKNTESIIRDILMSFLENSSDIETREFPDEGNQIREILVRSNYFSISDLRIAQEFEFQQLSSNPKFENIQSLINVMNEIFPIE